MVYSNSSILRIWPMSLFTLCIAAILRAVLVFHLIHTQRTKCHYTMRQNALFHRKASHARCILQCLPSATQNFMSSLKSHLCKMPLSVVTGKGSPSQVADERSSIQFVKAVVISARLNIPKFTLKKNTALEEEDQDNSAQPHCFLTTRLK